MRKDWTVLYLSETGASLQMILESEKEEMFESTALYEALYVYNKTYGYPDIAIPGFPIRFDKNEWLFQDGIVYILPPKTILLKPGFSQYKNILMENTIRHKVIVFEEVI